MTYPFACRRCRNLSEYMKLAEKVKEFFHNEGIHSTTIQPEFVEIADVVIGSQFYYLGGKKVKKHLAPVWE